MADLPSIERHDAEPLTAENDPFLPRIRYRADDYSTLRHKLLAHMEETFPTWNPTLAANAGQQDMGVALIELFAYLADVLGRYQDARANEAFLRTAVLRQSLIDLCTLIDYPLQPGSAASTLQAFLLKAGKAGTIPAAFKVKGEARSGQPAPIFESGRALAADAQRNKLHLAGWNRSGRKLSPTGLAATTTVLLDDGYAGLKAGGFVVAEAPGRSLRALQLTAVAAEGDKRRIHWEATDLPAGSNLAIADLVLHGKPKQVMTLAAAARADEITAGQTSARVTPAGTLAANDRVLFAGEGRMEPALILAASADRITWNRGFLTSLRRSRTTIYQGRLVGHTDHVIRRGATRITRQLSVHPPPAAGDQLLLSDAAGVERLMVAGVNGATIFLAEPAPRAFYPLVQAPTSDHATVQLHAVRLPGEGVVSNLSPAIHLQPERLSDLATELTLDRTWEGLTSGSLLVASDGEESAVGKVEEVRVEEERTVLTLESALGKPLKVADLRLHGPFELAMRVDGYDRSEELTVAGASSLELAGKVDDLKPGDYLVLTDGTTPGATSGSGEAEGLRITAVAQGGGKTTVSLQGKLAKSYPKATAVVYGNVVPVTHGETVVEEILGSGDHSQANQDFQLRKHPVTYVHDAEGFRGVRNTLQVFVNDELWQEVASLAESGPDERHYQVTLDEDEAMSFRFGDGRHGARLVTGRDNVRVRYRVGLGTAGNVSAGKLAKMPRTLDHVDSTTNPVAGSGGQDREELEVTRRLAPMTVRTLDRAVSLSDFADLALTYAGVAKARADWEWEQGRRRIALTVAATGGSALDTTLKEALAAYLAARSSPHQRLILRDFLPWPVRLVVEVTVAANVLRMETQERVEAALGSGLTADGERGTFHFDRLALGQDLYLSDVYARVEAVKGVDHALVRAFHPEGPPTPSETLQDRIRVPAGALARGGHPTDATVGILTVQAKGGIV